MSSTFAPTLRTQSLVSGSCDPGWVLYGSECYFNNQEKLNWTDANQACITMHASLASIHSKEENDFIHYLTGGVSSWIGIIDINNHSKTPPDHRWTDNSQVDYRNWNGAGNQPDPASAWYNKPSDQLAPSVCKKPAKNTLSKIHPNQAIKESISTPEAEQDCPDEISALKIPYTEHSHKGFVFNIPQSFN